MIQSEMKVSYSQNSEDRIVLQGVGDIKGGLVLDIGAGHPEKLSNSLAFIERGWRAILIEPSPVLFLELLKKHSGNPKVKLIHAAVGVESRLVRFFEAGDPLYSTTLEEHASKWKKSGITYVDYWVPQLSVKDLIMQAGIGGDVVSIDCEGISFDILTQCPLLEWNTRAVIVEHDSRIVEICGWAIAHEYEPKRVNAENIVLVKT